MTRITLLFALFFYSLLASAQMPHRDPSGLIREVKVYTSGSSTWTKPAGLVFIEVHALGGGGGGGSGRRGADNTDRCGGSGGNGGNYAHGIFQAAQLASSYTVNVGGTGFGGPVQTINNTNGNNGIEGGESSFGTLVRAKGGNGGAGGAQSGTVATISQNYINTNPSSSVTSMIGGRGGRGLSQYTGAFSTFGEPADGSANPKACPGGGGGTGLGPAGQTGHQTESGRPGIVFVSQYANQNWNQVAYRVTGTGQNQGASGANGINPPADNVIVQGSSLHFGGGGAGGAHGNQAGTVAGGFGGNGG
jgi:hypothetical protein